MTQKRFAILIAASASLTLGGCEFGPKVTSQNGYRGTGMNQVVNPSKVTRQQAIPANAYDTPDDSGPRAGATYQNVQVLSGISTERFNHFMANMNNWVVPAGLPESEQGCNYCHNPNNMASDEKYQKVAARKMIQMTQNINVQYTSHVKQTGVTCWTCHRGNAIPLNRWSIDGPEGNGTITGNRYGQNKPDPRVAFASLPGGSASKYWLGASSMAARVNNPGIHPSPNHVVSVKEAENVYGIMMQMSSGLGVNCTYCHNTGSFQSWNMSQPTRALAWYGIKMVQNSNENYVTPLGAVLPASQKEPHGDPYKIGCATCHNGINKPMYGVSMRAENPALWPAVAAVATAAPALMAPKADPNATAASCDADFAKALAGKTIEFDTGAATIRPASAPLLDNLVQIAGRCSRFKMSVEGHTDATGNAAANLTLSQARAAAVDKYLSERGVTPTQLVATGYGQTRPLDTSGTPVGNQRNRRIEINVGATPTGGSATGQ
jgi:photosynthetic reaction center cytochrome c subunit